MRRWPILAAALMLVLFGSGCATIFSGTRTRVNIKVDVEGPRDGIKEIYLGSGAAGRHSLRPGDNTLYLARASHPLLIRVVPNEGFDASIEWGGTVPVSFNLVTLVNILFWPGFLVDLATGAMWDYPVVNDLRITVKRKARLPTEEP